MADQQYIGPPETPQPSPDDGIHGSGISDAELTRLPVLRKYVDGMPYPVMTGYANNSILDMAYGASDPNIMATQMMQSGEMFRLQRGYPYKRAGHMVPVFPQFKSQAITTQNIASQPQANRSVQEITNPTIDTNTTNDRTGTAFIEYPGLNTINQT